MLSKTAFAAGAMTWSLAEYCIHRFIGHGPKRKKNASWRDLLSPSGLASEFNREHVAHHVQPMYFAPAERKLMAAAAVGVVSGVVASTLVGPRRGLSYTAGLVSMYGGYEVIHRRIHTHGPTGPYTRWVRMNHWHHHRAPKSNHGVTSPLWDLVFGTHEPVTKARMTRMIAPEWLLDDDGEVREEFREDYELVGSKARDETERAAAAS